MGWFGDSMESCDGTEPGFAVGGAMTTLLKLIVAPGGSQVLSSLNPKPL